MLGRILLLTVLATFPAHRLTVAGVGDCDSTLLTYMSTSAARSSIAFNGTGYGIAWRDQRTGESEIFFTRIDVSGTQIGSQVQVTTVPGGSAFDVDLVWDGSGYGVVWTDDRDGQEEIYFTRLDSTGTKLIGDVRLSALPGSSVRPRLAWSGSEYGIAWYDTAGWDRIYFTRLDSLGNELGVESAISPDSFDSRSPSLVWNGSGYGLAWTQGSSLLGFARLDATGQILGSAVQSSVASALKYGTDLVWNGTGYGVTWSTFTSVRFATLLSTGQISSPEFVVGTSANFTRPALAWSGSQYGVAYSNDDLLLNRRSAFGNSIGEDEVVLPGTNWSDAPDIAWNGSSYGVAADNSVRLSFSDFSCTCDAADNDGDGFSECDGDCDDLSAGTYPAAAELCDGNANDCGDVIAEDEIDNDGDGYVECQGWNDTQGDQPSVIGGGDCNDELSNFFPGAIEICDRLDTDCDGIADPGDPDVITNRDSDQDDLLDCWEVYGIDVDQPDLICRADASTECDLPLNRPPFLADPQRRDLFVEIDYMDCSAGGCAPTHDGHDSHRPHSEALALVVQAFARKGITAHFIGGQGSVDEPIPEIDPIVFGPISAAGSMDDFWDLKWGSTLPQDPCTPGSGSHFGTVADRESNNCAGRLDARRRVFRYVIFGHSSPEGWGTAENLGNDLLIGTGSVDVARAIHTVSERWSTGFDGEAADTEAGMLMHALGHSLGLGHGGVNGSGDAVDTPECRPNHLSAMNFTRTWNGAGAASGIPGIGDGTTVRTERVPDFGSVRNTGAVDLDELALSETVNVADSFQRFIFGDGNGAPIVTRADGSVDWNLDGSISGGSFQRDVTYVDLGAGSLGCPVSPGEILEQHDEWEVVRLAVPLTAATVDTPPTPPGTGDLTFPSIEPGAAEFLNGGLGAVDSDGDGVDNLADNCPLAADPDLDDLDGDGFGDLCDCLPADGNSWAGPSEAQRLIMTDPFSMTWEDPGFPGTSAGPLFDVLRANNRFFNSSTCVEANAADKTAIDLTIPTPGSVLFYLIRAETSCPDGLGSLGEGTYGIERSGPDCL